MPSCCLTFKNRSIYRCIQQWWSWHHMGNVHETLCNVWKMGAKHVIFQSPTLSDRCDPSRLSYLSSDCRRISAGNNLRCRFFSVFLWTFSCVHWFCCLREGAAENYCAESCLKWMDTRHCDQWSMGPPGESLSFLKFTSTSQLRTDPPCVDRWPLTSQSLQSSLLRVPLLSGASLLPLSPVLLRVFVDFCLFFISLMIPPIWALKVLLGLDRSFPSFLCRRFYIYISHTWLWDLVFCARVGLPRARARASFCLIKKEKQYSDLSGI